MSRKRNWSEYSIQSRRFTHSNLQSWSSAKTFTTRGQPKIVTQFSTWTPRNLNLLLVSIQFKLNYYNCLFADRIEINLWIQFTAHIMQIFQRRGVLISENMVKNYLRKPAQTLWGVKNRDDTKRIIRKKIKNEKENDQWTFEFRILNTIFKAFDESKKNTVSSPQFGDFLISACHSF